MKTERTIEIECLLQNGREVYLMLESPRDTVSESDGVVTYTRHPEKGITEETVIARAQVAYLRTRTIDAGVDASGIRTLGIEAPAQSS